MSLEANLVFQIALATFTLVVTLWVAVTAPGVGRRLSMLAAAGCSTATVGWYILVSTGGLSLDWGRWLSRGLINAFLITFLLQAWLIRIYERERRNGSSEQ